MTLASEEKPPKITREQVLEYAGETIVKRAQSYVGNALKQHQRTGAEIRAHCQGSQPRPYRVSATLGERRVLKSACTCPYDGVCKHVAALLLAYIEKPEDFAEGVDLAEALNRLERQQLVALVQRMIAREPHLETLVSMVASPPSMPPDLAQVRSQIDSLLDGILNEFEYLEYDEYDLSEIDDLEIALEPYLLIAEKSLDAGAVAQATEIYALVAEGLQQLHFHLETEEFAHDTLLESIEGIGRSLQIGQTPEEQQTSLDLLLTLYEKDAVRGMYVARTPVVDALDQYATPEMKREAAARLRVIMASVYKYTRQSIREDIEDLMQEAVDPDERIEMLRENEEYEELLEALLELGRTEEALDAARSAPVGETTNLADILAQHNLTDEAVRLVESQLEKSLRNRGLLGWLLVQAVSSNDENAILRYRTELFDMHNSAQNYVQLREAAQTSEKWPKMRAGILKKLERSKNYTLLAEIHLAEGDIETALASYALTTGGWHLSAHESSLHIRLARAAETQHLHEAVTLYLDAAESLIRLQGRENYIHAVRLLGRIKMLYVDAGMPELWRRLLDRILTNYPTLRALREEIAKAKL